jgi:hypothetical protein
LLRQDVQRAATPLDDVTRARLLSALAGPLDGLAAGDGRRFSPGWWPRLAARLRRAATDRRALVAGVALVAAAVVLVLIDGRQPAPRSGVVARVVDPPVDRAPAGAPAKVVESGRSLTLLAPGPRSPRKKAARSRLESQRRELVEATLDGRASLALAGPGAVEVIANSGDTVELRLSSGALVVDYDRRRGGRLRIHSPGAVTEVVGTLFTVEVIGSQSRVSVQRGKVVIQSAGQSRLLRAGQSLASDAPAAGPLPASSRALLREYRRPHLALTTAPAAVAAPPASASAPPPAVPAPTLEVSPPAVPSPAPATVPPVAPPPVAPPPPREPSLSERYRRAEAAMSRGDRAQARSELETLVARGGREPMAVLARYELAQMALRAGDRPGALRWVDELGAGGVPPDLEEAARFLRCEVALAGKALEPARRCLEDFRAAHPGSTRDSLALGLLLRILPAAQLCGRQRELLDQFLDRHRDHRFAAELAARREACPR